MGGPGRFLLDGSEASAQRRAVRREPTETETLKTRHNQIESSILEG
jgi:hypothetical protein